MMTLVGRDGDHPSHLIADFGVYVFQGHIQANENHACIVINGGRTVISKANDKNVYYMISSCVSVWMIRHQESKIQSSFMKND